MTDLPAGPKLDRLIAEKVMGWTVTGAPSLGECRKGQWFWNKMSRVFLREGDYGDCEIWSPSTNIVHAWVVVEKMQENKYKFCLSNENEANWSALFYYTLPQFRLGLFLHRPARHLPRRPGGD